MWRSKICVWIFTNFFLGDGVEKHRIRGIIYQLYFDPTFVRKRKGNLSSSLASFGGEARRIRLLVRKTEFLFSNHTECKENPDDGYQNSYDNVKIMYGISFAP
jgi:hypothetical protein